MHYFYSRVQWSAVEIKRVNFLSFETSAFEFFAWDYGMNHTEISEHFVYVRSLGYRGFQWSWIQQERKKEYHERKKKTYLIRDWKRGLWAEKWLPVNSTIQTCYRPFRWKCVQRESANSMLHKMSQQIPAFPISVTFLCVCGHFAPCQGKKYLFRTCWILNASRQDLSMSIMWSINCSLLRLDNNQEENVRLDSYFVFFAFLLLRFDLYFAETQVFSNKGRMLIQSSLQVELHYVVLVVYSSIHPIAISFLRRQHQPCLVCVVRPAIVLIMLRYTQTWNDIQSPKTTYNHFKSFNNVEPPHQHLRPLKNNPIPAVRLGPKVVWRNTLWANQLASESCGRNVCIPIPWSTSFPGSTPLSRRPLFAVERRWIPSF